MKATFIVKLRNDTLLTWVKIWFMLLKIWPMKLGHASFILFHGRKESIFVIGHNIWPFMAIHIYSLS
jgi:hypothetical protein